MRNNNGPKSSSMERQNTEPCMDQNTFNLLLNISPSTAQMLASYAPGTFFDDVSHMTADAVAGGRTMTMELPSQQLGTQPNMCNVPAPVEITPAMVEAALRRSNGGVSGAAQCNGLGVQGVANFTRASTALPHTIQGCEDQYNYQNGAGMYPVPQREQPLLQQQHHQLQQPLSSVHLQPQMECGVSYSASQLSSVYSASQLSSVYSTSQLSSCTPQQNSVCTYPNSGVGNELLPSAPYNSYNTVAPCTPRQNSVCTYQSSGLQENSGYLIDQTSTPNIGDCSSHPTGVIQVQKQLQVIQGSDATYVSNAQQITASPCAPQPATYLTSSRGTLADLPHSPCTEETLYTLEELEMYPESSKPSLNQFDELSHITISKSDFAPESKFDPSPASSTRKLVTESLSRADSIDVMQLTDFPGIHDFSISFPADARNNRKWGYNTESKRVFCQPNTAVEVQVRVKDWRALEGADARVRLCPVYTDAHHRTTPVTRCDHHKLYDQTMTKSEEVNYLIQIDQKDAHYDVVGQRQIVSAPLQPSRVGEEFATLLVKCSCMTSCVGGPNRRPFSVIFSLMVKDEEAGRRILAFKCCKGVCRDMKAEKEKLAAESLTLDPPAPKTHTITINLESRKRKIDRITPATSDAERSPGKSRRSGNRAVNLPDVASPPPGYCYMLLPIEYKQRVMEYLNALRAQAYLRDKHPDVYKNFNL